MRVRVIAWFRHALWRQLLGMGVCLVGFGLMTMNLFQLAHVNLVYISQDGFMALRQGAGVQLLEIAVQSVVAVLCYAGLKVFEKLVIEWFLGDWH